MADLQGRLLLALKEKNIVNSEDLAREWQEDHQKIVGAIKSLQTLYKVRSLHKVYNYIFC